MDNNEIAKDLTILLEVTNRITKQIEDHEVRLRSIEVTMYKAIGIIGACSLLISRFWEIFKLVVK